MHDDEAQSFSDEVAPRIIDEINACLQPQQGMITAFIGLINYMDSDGQQYWSFVSMDGQSITQSAGMRDVLDKIVDGQLNDAMFGPRE